LKKIDAASHAASRAKSSTTLLIHPMGIVENAA